MNEYIGKVLKSSVSFQKNTWSSFTKEMLISEVLSDIKSDIYLYQISKLRELYKNGDLQVYNAEKLRLPAVTFCGIFDTERKKEKLREYNYLIVIDIDKLNSEQLIEIEKKLSNDKYVLSFWKSPSNFGIKGIVPLKYNFEFSDIDVVHKSAFNKLYEYFLSIHNIELDRSGSDTTRLCFLSHDPEIIIKSNAEFFQIDKEDLNLAIKTKTKLAAKIKVFDKSKKNALYNPENRNKSNDKRAIKDILIYLSKRRIVITGEYENRYKIAYAIADTFTFDIGKLFFLDLCKIETDKYNKQRELKLLEYCYENNSGLIKFKYIEELVNNYGYVKKTLEKVVS